MSDVPIQCSTPVNPDISGIGVRTSIYIQNLLCLLSAIWALWDGKVTPGKLEYAEMQTTTNLILAFAILISSIVQAHTLGISSYHANIVLMMSWMNNTNAFVYFILYIHHKIGLHEGEGGVAATGGAWVKYVKESFCLTMSGLNDRDTEAGTALNDRATNHKGRRGAKVLVKRFVLVLGSLHLALMATLGIWLWSNLQLFGLGNRRPADFVDANTCAVNGATVAVFGQGVSLGSPTLRAFAIAIYALFLIPGVNLIAPMIIFLVAYPVCRRLPFASRRREALPPYIGLGILLAINIVFIVDIEVTRGFNRALQDKDEGDWGFG
ncbi:hypothetical protein BKA70DRAFT_669321 [Coprinopsis sp. MPI-PUGE-AT-0042]|nr:hypothetical protein BKA70DRAFT_669321 [Coprinopsis sp. MPI-PUGE-AT-0042]